MNQDLVMIVDGTTHHQEPASLKVLGCAPNPLFKPDADLQTINIGRGQVLVTMGKAITAYTEPLVIPLMKTSMSSLIISLPFATYPETPL